MLLLGPRLLRETAVAAGPRSYDPLGAITVTGALVLLAYAVVEAPVAGWASVQTLGLLAGAAVLFVLFLVVERVAKAPLVPLRIFRLRTMVGGNAMTLLVSMTIYGGALMMSVYAQEVLGWSAVQFGLSTAIYAAMSVVGSNLAGPLTTRFGYRKVAVLGAAALSVGAFLLSRVSAEGSYWTDLLPAMVVFGYGIGTTVVAAAIAALSNVAPQESGLASGINNSIFQVGAAFGIALCTSVSVAFTDTSAPDQRIALNEGVQAAFGAAFVFAVCCAAVAIVLNLLRNRTPAGVGQSAPTDGAAL